MENHGHIAIFAAEDSWAVDYYWDHFESTWPDSRGCAILWQNEMDPLNTGLFNYDPSGPIDSHDETVEEIIHNINCFGHIPAYPEGMRTAVTVLQN